MVRNYKRKTDVAKRYNDVALKNALESISQGTPLIRVSRQFNIPARTLRRHRDSKVSSPGEIILGRYRQALPPKMEQELASRARIMTKMFHGLSSKEIRRLAYDFAKNMDIEVPFNDDTKMAGVDWLNAFMKRHNLSARTAEATSVARMVGFNRAKVGMFFDIYKELMTKK